MDLTKILNRSIQIYLVTLVQKKTDYLRSLYGSDQDSEQINSDLSGNICSKENRLSKITLYRSDQDSEQINSDLSGNICSSKNRLSKITLYRSDQDSEWINSDLSGNICSKENRSLFIDLTKILNRSIQIYLVTFVQNETD